MSSGSDDEEFYDAADEISPEKAKQKSIEVESHPINSDINIETAETPDAISNPETASELPRELNTEEPLLTKVVQKTKSIELNKDTPINDDATTPTIADVPVAPPRRKKKQKKELLVKESDETIPVQESISEKDSDDPPNGRNENQPIKSSKPARPNTIPLITRTAEIDEPCVYIGKNRNDHAMEKVLVKGNSLDVVFNDDLAERRSGLSPSKMFKTIDEGEGGSQDGSHSSTKLVRCNSVSGRPLSDIEILEQVVVTNLDTGECIPLSLAEDKIPKAINPLALHIMRLTSEFASDQNLADGNISDSSTTSSIKGMKRKKLKQFLGKTVQKIKLEVKARRGDESSSSDEEEGQQGSYIKLKCHKAIREKAVFQKVRLLQDLSGEHIGAIWTMKFSLCSRLLATAGQDNIVRIWVLKDAFSHFEDMRAKYSKQIDRSSSPTSSINSMASNMSTEEDTTADDSRSIKEDDVNDFGPFRKIPFSTFHGHTSDVLDLSWSKNYFILSSSMDKTVRLWHISRQECLCCFQHVDFVTAIAFHPRDDRYFLSGSLDGKLRLWNIPEKKVALWNEIDGTGTRLITAANFCQDGKLAVVGTYDGRCIFYDTERLKYHTQVTVRSTRGKNAIGRKISGIEPMPGEDKVLVSSNDSRVRLYDLKDHSLYCKYKGSQNVSSQIKASFSNNGKYLLCGSEDRFVYIWRTYHDVQNARKDRNEYYECFSAHDAVVTAAIFVPIPSLVLPQAEETADHDFEVIASADWTGSIKLFVNQNIKQNVD